MPISQDQHSVDSLQRIRKPSALSRKPLARRRAFEPTHPEQTQSEPLPSSARRIVSAPSTLNAVRTVINTTEHSTHHDTRDTHDILDEQNNDDQHSHENIDHDEVASTTDPLDLTSELGVEQSSDIVQSIQFIRRRMFTHLPEDGRGLHSTLVSAVLRRQASIPPVATLGHLQTVLISAAGRSDSLLATTSSRASPPSRHHQTWKQRQQLRQRQRRLAHSTLKYLTPSEVEKDLVSLVRRHVIRRIVVPQRCEVFVCVRDIDRLASEAVDNGLLLPTTKQKYMQFVRDLGHYISTEEDSPNESIVGTSTSIAPPFHDDLPPLVTIEIDELIRAGFLTSSSLHDSNMKATGSHSSGGGGGGGGVIGDGGRGRGDTSSGTSKGTVPVNVSEIVHFASRAGTGTTNAAGGELGQAYLGTGSASQNRLLGTSDRDTLSGLLLSDLSLSLPGMGAFVTKLTQSIDQLLRILNQSPFHEMPESFLRERWDGGGHANRAKPRTVSTGTTRDDLAKLSSVSSSSSGSSGLVAGKTYKWKVLHGVSFDWVLGEALGRGVIEFFDTGTVGRGVRAV